MNRKQSNSWMARLLSAPISVLALGMALFCGLVASPAQAQDLEDSLEAELDENFDVEPDISPAALESESETGSVDLHAQAEPAFTAEASGVIVDEPNLDLEKRLHRIFQNAEPIRDEKWSAILGVRRTDVYAVQAGDTLWDISKTFFGDGFFWSKLWAENSSIQNPHRISPGKGIRFISGDEAEPPRIEVTETPVFVAHNSSEQEPLNLAAPYYQEDVENLIVRENIEQGLIELDEVIPRPELPPPPKPRPLLRKLPSSFKSRVIRSKDEYDKSGLSVGRRAALTSAAVVVPNSYLMDASPSGIGSVEEIELSEKVASFGQNVYVRLTRAANVGDRFSVVRVKEKIKDKVRGSVGPVIEIGGRVEIQEVVEATKNVYKATVIFALNPIPVGSLIISEQLPTASFSRSGSYSEAAVRVLGAEYDEERKIFGENSVIYLDGGSKAGLKENDLLTVQARRGDRRESTKFPDSLRPIALVKVVKTQETVATAIVLESLEEIQPGDMTGGQFPSGLRDLKTIGADELSQRDGFTGESFDSF